MIIRQLNSGDVPAVREIARPSFTELWGPEQFTKLIHHPHRVALGAWSDTGLAGYFLGLRVGGELDVVSIAVAPHLRSQGVGETLMRAAMEDAGVVTLEVAHTNASALRLYEKLGFEEVGRRPRYYRGTEDALLMRLKRN